MDYKLLRALSIVLQAGLVILIAMLLSLIFLSCKPAVLPNTVMKKTGTESQKDIMEQRFLQEINKSRLNIKTLCFEKQAAKMNSPI